MEGSRRTRRIAGLSPIFFSLFLLFGVEIAAQESFNRSAEFRIAHGYLQRAQLSYGEGRYDPAVRSPTWMGTDGRVSADSGVTLIRGFSSLLNGAPDLTESGGKPR